MRVALTLISVGWGILAIVIVGFGAVRIFFPRVDDLGVGVLVVSSFTTAAGIAAVVMLAGAGMGVYALMTRADARTPGRITATVGTLAAVVGLAYFLTRVSSA